MVDLTEAERDEVETEISEKVCDRKREFPGTIEISMMDAANHAFQGVYEFADGREICFSGNCGDINGFFIKYSDKLFTEELPGPTVRKLVPIKKNVNPQVLAIFLKRNKQKLSEANYDLTFSPTEKVRRHYDEYFAKQGLRLEID